MTSVSDRMSCPCLACGFGLGWSYGVHTKTRHVHTHGSKTSGKEVQNLQHQIFAFSAILLVVDSVSGRSVMPKIA